MKKVFLSAIALIFSAVLTNVLAQDKKEDKKKDYKFEKIYDLDATSVKNQFRSGTCWSFSGLSFLESEMIAAGKEPIDLSEMFVVRNCYAAKAKKYVRMHGSLNFGAGGSFEDVIFSLKEFGAVPEQAYTGLHYGTKKHVHGEMDAILKAYVDAVIKNKNKKLSPAWYKGYVGILDAYLGEYPKEFTYKGKQYTPKSFAKEVVGLNPDDYIMITSYMHHPYNEKFIIEIPDNWIWGEVYNVTLEDMMEIIESSLKNGHSIAWGSDVSEKGFSFRNGVAIVPETEIEEIADSERGKWEKMTKKERALKMYSFNGPVPEKVITPEMRQEQFDNYQTTDDHGMQITGMYKDQNGKIYYKVKNSWDTNNKYDGYFYASKPFVQLKTMDFMINKNTLPKSIKKKLGIK